MDNEMFLVNISSVSTSEVVAVLFIFILVVIPYKGGMPEEVKNPVWLGGCSEMELHYFTSIKGKY